MDLSNVNLNRLSPSKKRELILLLTEKQKLQENGGHLYKFFPDTGPFSWKKYTKHIEFFQAGKIFRERLFMAGNRVGKTICGTYESACHLTGLYPDWWDGRTFDHPTDGWAAGDTGQTTRDIIQKELLGPPGALGTGMLAKDLIVGVTSRPGIPNAVDSITVKHVSGGTSRLGFKSYDQKRRSFQGTAKHFIHFDEEPPAEVYGEAIIRTMTTNGLIYVTCTPLQGLTAFIQDFMDEAVTETKEEVEDFG